MTGKIRTKSGQLENYGARLNNALRLDALKMVVGTDPSKKRVYIAYRGMVDYFII